MIKTLLWGHGVPSLVRELRVDWLDLLAVQGTLKSLLQHHSSKASVLQCSACFTVQLSHPYMTTGKTIPLTTQTFVGKIMSLFFNMLSRLVITFRSPSLASGFFITGTTREAQHLYSFTFPEGHRVGIMQYFSEWLLSFSDMHLSFFHVFSSLDKLTSF